MRATLISWTANPIETLYTIWEQSKHDDPLTGIIEDAFNGSYSYNEDRTIDRARELFRAVMDQDIPVAESIVFNFVCEDVPISWREQAVRHRVGVRYGDNFAVDVIPDADLSFWSQSHRLKDMSRFADRREYFVPDSIRENPDALATYEAMMRSIEWGYRELVDQCGIPMEDARNLLPLGATHRIAMTVNLKSLKNIIGKRGCWILQAGIWQPIIETMVEELSERIDPIFRMLIHPPCVEGGCFKSCTFKVENERRQRGDDPLPVCPLWWTSEPYLQTRDTVADPPMVEEVERRIPQYARLWDQPNLAKTWQWEDRANEEL